MPGARGVAVALGGPGYFEPSGLVEVEGEGAQRVQDERRVIWNAVTPGFFSLVDLEIRRGRGVEDSDRAENLPVAVVNEAFVASHLPAGEALGKRLRVPGADSATLFTIVGVAEDLDMGTGPGAMNERVYLALRQIRAQAVLAMARSGGDPTTLTPALRRAVADVDPLITFGP